MKRLLVIGGGAAGMMAALAAAQSGAEVELFEQNEKLGKKLYITGKGRCNFTNACEAEDFPEHIVSGERFFRSAFARFDNRQAMAFFEEQGLPIKVERGNRVFPKSDKSSDVIRALTGALASAGIKVHLGARASGLLMEDGRVQGLRLVDGQSVSGDAVVLATGGLSYPATGSTGDGYRMAAECGHALTATYPSLVPLLVEGEYIRQVKGLSLRNVRLTIDAGGKKPWSGFGEMLFTDRGISGPLVLRASAYLAAALAQGGAEGWIDFKPALDEEQLRARLIREFSSAPKKEIKNILPALFPSSLRPVILARAGLDPERRAAEISRGEREALLSITKRFPLAITGTAGFDEAVITQGGVDLREVDPRTMESKKIKGLFFAGEILDIDALTGGFNLQIAWSTGQVAGRVAAERRKPMSTQIAIDGPSGAGKSTIARGLAKRLGFLYVDTGAMYRAMAVHFLDAGIDTEDEAATSAAARGARIRLEMEEDGQHVYLDGEDVTGRIRTEEVGMIASRTSAYAEVRRILVAMQQNIAASRDVVMDGRDIGTVVLPDATVKVYLTASVAVRAKRRFDELAGRGEEVDLAQVEEDIRQRDKQDMEREVSPLRQAEDAVLVDSSDLGIEEVMDRIEALL